VEWRTWEQEFVRNLQRKKYGFEKGKGRKKHHSEVELAIGLLRWLEGKK